MGDRAFKLELYEQFARVGKALASSHRLEMLDLLTQGPRTVDSLGKEIDLSIANASSHLNVLKDARLVESRKDGLFVHYSLADDAVAGLLRQLRAVAEKRIAEIDRERVHESFAYGEPALVARHRFGMTDNLTSGFHAEFDRSRTNAGSELTIAAALGELELHLASSSTIEPSPRRGTAGIVGYAYHGGGVSLRATVRAASHDYSSLSLDPAHERSLVEHVTSVGHTLGARSNLTADVAFAWLRDAGASARLGLTVSTRLSRALALQIRTSRSRAGLAAWQHDLFAVLSVALPLHHSAELTEHVGSAGREVTGRISRPLREPTDVGYQVSGAVGNTPRATGNVQGQASFGRLGATYMNFGGQENTIVEASGSVVLVKNDVYFTQPVSQSFAVIEVPGAPGVRGYFNNREMGRTDGNGRLFIPNLLPYQSNRLSIAAEDLPIDYELEAEELTLAPPTRGGAVVTFPAHRVRFVRGWIERRLARGFAMLEDGMLSVVTSKGTFVSLIGNDGEFELEGLPEGEWEGSVRSSAGSCAVVLVVGPSDEAVQNLRAIICNDNGPKVAQP